MTRAANPPSLSTGAKDVPKANLDLSVHKVIGGALAAVTTAVAASFLGVTGTISGAAFGSIVSTIAAALYATSLRTAGHRLRATKNLVAGSPAAGVAPTDPTGVPPELLGRSVRVGDVDHIQTFEEPVRHPPTTYTSRRRPMWKPALLLAGMVFVIAVAAISVFELTIGHPIANASDSGTSIGTVVRGDQPATTRPTRTESPGASQDPTDTRSRSSDASPTESGSKQPGRGDQTPSDSAGQPTDGGQQPGAGQGQQTPNQQTPNKQTPNQQETPNQQAPNQQDAQPTGQPSPGNTP